MSELVIVGCVPQTARCDGRAALSAEREALVRARFDEARALLEPAGLWARAPVVALDARLGGTVATTFADAANEGFSEFLGRPVVFFDSRLGAVPDLDVVLHELTHVWLRAAGAGDARWRFEPGRDGSLSERANHESAMVHEGLADFVAAALTGDPVLGEGLGERFGTTSLRVEVRCPDGLTGSPHLDSLVVSGALWELGGAGQDAASMAEVLGAVRGVAVEGSSGVERFSRALREVLDEAHAARWDGLVERRGLERCDATMDVGGSRVSARAGDFIAAGTGRFGGSGPVGGPLGFSARVGGADTAKVLARSSESHALSVDWRALGASGEVLGAGVVPLVAAPSSWVSVALPTGSQVLDFVFTTATSNDVAYNDVRVMREVRAAPEPVAPGGAGSGCGVGMMSGVELGLVLYLVAQRFRRARTSASGSSQSDSQATASIGRADRPRR